MKTKTVVKAILVLMFLVIVYDTIFNVHTVSIHSRYKSLLNGEYIK